MIVHRHRILLKAAFILIIAVFHPALLMAQAAADVSAIAHSAQADAAAPPALRILAVRIADRGAASEGARRRRGRGIGLRLLPYGDAVRVGLSHQEVGRRPRV